MDTTTIVVILVGIVVVLVLVGVISSIVRGDRGKAQPPESVVEISDHGAEPGAASPGADSAEDELKARAEEKAREEDAAEQEQVARKIDEDLDAGGTDDSASAGTDDSGQDRETGHGRHRPGSAQDR